MRAWVRAIIAILTFALFRIRVVLFASQIISVYGVLNLRSSRPPDDKGSGGGFTPGARIEVHLKNN